MEWVSIAVWALVALVVLPVGGGAFAAPPLGLQPLLGVAGFALAVLFAILGEAALAWAAAGLGVLGAATTGIGVAQLLADAGDTGRAEELAATLAGAAWPLYLTAGAMSMLAALAADGTI